VKATLTAILVAAIISGLFWLAGWNFDERGFTALLWASMCIYFGAAALFWLEYRKDQP